MKCKTLFYITLLLALVYSLVSCTNNSTEPQNTINGFIDTSGPDRDCSDFASHAEAQEFFEAAGGPAQDPHRLDRDGDGLACERN